MRRAPVPPEVETWAFCLRCGRPLTSAFSQTEGFGLHCGERLTRQEREAMRRGARQMRAVEGDGALASRWEWFVFRVRDRLGLFERH